jgi:deoxycytidine triphosphate deaminase
LPCSRLPQMILSDRSIKEEIALGCLEIEPFDEACVQPSSVDLHVDRTFRNLPQRPLTSSM